METGTIAATIALLAACGSAFVWVFRAMGSLLLSVWNESKPYLEAWLEIQRERSRNEQQRYMEAADTSEVVQRMESAQKKMHQDLSKVISSQRMLVEAWARENPENEQLYTAAGSLLKEKRDGGF